MGLDYAVMQIMQNSKLSNNCTCYLQKREKNKVEAIKESSRLCCFSFSAVETGTTACILFTVYILYV